jgi:8-oxo-dGTP pyrophosphatase MutT (NUDIX family)
VTVPATTSQPEAPTWHEHLPRKRAAATMLITDPAARVLVVKPAYKPLWELPGGAVEENESPRSAAAREIVEELGIHRTPGRLLALDYVPADPQRGRTDGMIVVFDGGIVNDPATLRLPPEELSDHAFVAAALLDQYLPALQARRAIAALHARATGRTTYLEDGRQS